LEWVRKAAEAGKGVVCEKPTAASVVELEAMIQACSAASVPFLDGTMFHFHKRMEEMKAVWSAPSFGAVGRVNSSFTFRGDEAFFSGNIRTDPVLEPFGCLGDLGQYSIRFGLEVYGWELPANVRCVAHQTNKAGVPMDISATFVYPTGGPDGGPRTILCDNSFTMAFHQVAEVIGTLARVHVDDFVISASHASCEYTTYHSPNLDASHCAVIGLTQTHKVEGCNQEKDMWEAFGKAVEEKRFVPLWAERALKVQACLDAALLSSQRDGAPVEIKRPALLDSKVLFPDGCA
jgi:predicted dehydrogenase